jgi:cyclopropane-fatty-acyl-phospholipid synthase
LEKISGHGRDLGFNLYDGNLTKDHYQSQIDKWEFMLNELDLRAGDRLIDIGCGYGDWLNYARKKGIEVTGINISPEQTHYAKSEYDLDVICCNWKDILIDRQLQQKLYGRFDAVTFMDSIEHFVHYTKGWDKEADTIYQNVFRLADRLLKAETRTGSVFISCLHLNPNVVENSKFAIFKTNLKIAFSTLFMIRSHSGCYPYGDDGLTKHCAPHFTEVRRYDKTEDYRLTAVLDKNHFQSPKIRWTLSKIMYIPLFLVLDPHHIYKWLDHCFDAWMNCYGKDNYALTYDITKRRQTSFVTLWWIVFKHNRFALQGKLK